MKSVLAELSDSPWAFVAAALVIVPAFIAFGVYMIARPEEFARRRRTVTTVDESRLPTEIIVTRLFGVVLLAFTVVWVGLVVGWLFA